MIYILSLVLQTLSATVSSGLLEVNGGSMRVVKLTLAIALIACSIISWEVLDSYRWERYPPPPLGKYEEIAIYSDLYHRWYQVTPPSYAKVFLPIYGYQFQSHRF